MSRAIDVFVMLIGGFLLGWLAAPPPPDSDPRTSAVVADGAAVRTAPGPAPACPEPDADEPPPPAPAPPAAAPGDPLPPAYLDIVEPVATMGGQWRPWDSYAAFARELRDESWANAMEAGVEAWTRRQPDDGALVDYAECRQATCVFAGHASGGDTSALNALVDEGWWLASGGISVAQREARNDSMDFVVFAHRYATP